MPQIASWNGHSFEVGAGLVRGFDALTVKGSCETEEKNTEKQKYMAFKYSNTPEISMTVGLNGLCGIRDVMQEAMAFVREASAGETAYFYLGGGKLVPAAVMLVSAEIRNIQFMPGRGDRWVSCEAALTFKQGGKSDGSATGSAGGGTTGRTQQKESVREQSPTGGAPASPQTATETEAQKKASLFEKAAASAKKKLAEAQRASRIVLSRSGGGSLKETNRVQMVE